MKKDAAKIAKRLPGRPADPPFARVAKDRVYINSALFQLLRRPTYVALGLDRDFTGGRAGLYIWRKTKAPQFQKIIQNYPGFYIAAAGITEHVPIGRYELHQAGKDLESNQVSSVRLLLTNKKR